MANKNVEEIRVELVKNTNDLSDEQYDALTEEEQKEIRRYIDEFAD